MSENKRGNESRQNLCDEFEKLSGKSWFTNPVCHGETAFASWDYQLWLEAEVIRLREEKRVAFVTLPQFNEKK